MTRQFNETPPSSRPPARQPLISTPGLTELASNLHMPILDPSTAVDCTNNLYAGVKP